MTLKRKLENYLKSNDNSNNTSKRTNIRQGYFYDNFVLVMNDQFIWQLPANEVPPPTNDTDPVITQQFANFQNGVQNPFNVQFENPFEN